MVIVFSQKASNLYGFSWYRLEDGREVAGTAMYDSVESAQENYKWDDMRIVGLGEWSRQGPSKSFYIPIGLPDQDCLKGLLKADPEELPS